MNKLIGIVALLFSTTAWAAPSICVNSKSIWSGELCTIRPSQTDPMIQDGSESNRGFGDHVIGFPVNSNNKLWVHFGGSGAKPYLPNPNRYLNESWLSEIMGQGYTVIDLAYDNEVSITESCQGQQLNNCAGAARREVLSGVDTSPLRNVNTQNSIIYRLRVLIDYLTENNVPLPIPSFEGWNNLSVSGHSQGAGVSYFIAKFNGVVFACYLGGPYDVPDPIPNQRPPAQYIADWYLDTSANNTPVNNMGAFLTVQDENYKQFTFAYDLIGLKKEKHWFEADKRRYVNEIGNPVDGHAAAVQDPSLAELRARACF